MMFKLLSIYSYYKMLTIFFMLYNTSLRLFYTQKFVPLNPLHLYWSPPSSPLATTNLFSIYVSLLLFLYVHDFVVFFQIPRINDSIQCLSFRLTCFTQPHALQVHLCCFRWQISFFVTEQFSILHVYLDVTAHLLYLVIC